MVHTVEYEAHWSGMSSAFRWCDIIIGVNGEMVDTTETRSTKTHSYRIARVP
jgi:hypothetical protein